MSKLKADQKEYMLQNVTDSIGMKQRDMWGIIRGNDGGAYDGLAEVEEDFQTFKEALENNKKLR